MWFYLNLKIFKWSLFWIKIADEVDWWLRLNKLYACQVLAKLAHKYDFYLNFLNNFAIWLLNWVETLVWSYVHTKFRPNRFHKLCFIWIWKFKMVSTLNELMDDVDQWIVFDEKFWPNRFINLVFIWFLNGSHLEIKWLMTSAKELI